MLKTVGLAMVFSVCTLIGFRASERLRCRYKKLLSHYILIEEIAELMRVGTELETVFKNERAADLLIADGYSASVKPEELNAEDIRLLEEFFGQLGMGDIEAQLSRCATYRELLSKRVYDAEQEMKSKSRLYSLLGIFFGIFAVIIVI